MPLIADGEVLGALNVSRVGGPEVYFSESDFELIQLFAGQASIALRNADAHHAVSQRADTDALTGLANHGAFQRDLGALSRRPGPDGQCRRASARVLMMDLDCFKAYNDRHGHPAGDALLHRAATAIYGAARSERPRVSLRRRRVRPHPAAHRRRSGGARRGARPPRRRRA